jgi:hypothetical protein
MLMSAYILCRCFLLALLLHAFRLRRRKRHGDGGIRSLRHFQAKNRGEVVAAQRFLAGTARCPSAAGCALAARRA